MIHCNGKLLSIEELVDTLIKRKGKDAEGVLKYAARWCRKSNREYDWSFFIDNDTRIRADVTDVQRAWEYFKRLKEG